MALGEGPARPLLLSGGPSHTQRSLAGGHIAPISALSSRDLRLCPNFFLLQRPQSAGEGLPQRMTSFELDHPFGEKGHIHGCQGAGEPHTVFLGGRDALCRHIPHQCPFLPDSATLECRCCRGVWRCQAPRAVPLAAGPQWLTTDQRLGGSVRGASCWYRARVGATRVPWGGKANLPAASRAAATSC